MPEKKFKELEAKIIELIGSEGTFANDVSRDLGGWVRIFGWQF